MAVSEQVPYIEYMANGATKTFALTFECQNKDHLMVFLNDIAVLPTAFSLSLGNVVFNSAPLLGTKVQLQRSTPLSRSTNYQSYNNSLRPNALNSDFDRLWLAMQEQHFKSFQIEQKLNKLIDIFNNFGLLPRVSNLNGNDLMLVSQEQETRSATIDQILSYLSASIPQPKPILTLAALLNEQTVVGNTAAQASISVSIDKSLTAQMRADGLEIKGTAEPNANIQIKVEG